MKRIYLDYASTTPVDPRVRAAMLPYETEIFGNPGSLHLFGQEASGAIFKSRRSVAQSIGAAVDEIIFTGSATEANNLALRGVVSYAQNVGEVRKPRIIVSSIEHESVLETARALEREGVEVCYLPVSRTGVIDHKALERGLTKNTVLVSIMYANNEIGVIEPLAEIANIIKNRTTPYPLFHTDASQALQFLDCRVPHLGVDLMTLSSHKVYGPKGIGALYVRSDRIEATSRKKSFRSPVAVPLSPIITGGGQEQGLRSGTENVAGIVGFGRAVEIIDLSRERERRRVGTLRDYLWLKIQALYPRAVKNTPKRSLPNNLNIFFPNRKAHDMLVSLDLMGVASSAGSACTARSSRASHVLAALGFSKARQEGSIRFSLGRFTRKSDLDAAARILKKILA